jgi:hypothetical protein
MKNGRAADAISARCTRKTSRRIAISGKVGTSLSRKQTPSKYQPPTPPNPPPTKRKSHERGYSYGIAVRLFSQSLRIDTNTFVKKKKTAAL